MTGNKFEDNTLTRFILEYSATDGLYRVVVVAHTSEEVLSYWNRNLRSPSRELLAIYSEEDAEEMA